MNKYLFCIHEKKKHTPFRLLNDIRLNESHLWPEWWRNCNQGNVNAEETDWSGFFGLPQKLAIYIVIFIRIKHFNHMIPNIIQDNRRDAHIKYLRMMISY